MKSFEELLQVSTRIHGHICAGQVIGVRMSILALRLLGLSDPQGADRKKIYVIVEIDRCATDAIQSVTGCSLGKRSMKWLDHGIMAATFVNLESSQAVRVTALEEARDLANKYCSEIVDKYSRQLEAYKIMPETELFRVESVSLTIPPEDLPGKPLRRVKCVSCGDWVQDCRDVVVDDKILCRSCTHGRYYSVIEQ
ncbi:MAG: FmdE family protein [Desulforhopalus sp.]|nr:FmdE family protein [Desulforhopalus sp.]